MDLRGIVSVSGKPGLWRAISQNKTGFILESLDVQKTKLIANLTTAKIAALDEITIFGADEDIRLLDVFERMKTEDTPPDAKADGKAMRRYFREVAPDHDEEKVYASDMKKVISWFNILKDQPFFNTEAPAAEETPAEETSVETVDAAVAEVPETVPAVVDSTIVAEEEPAKPAAKKAKKK